MDNYKTYYHGGITASGAFQLTNFEWFTKYIEARKVIYIPPIPKKIRIWILKISPQFKK